MIFGGEKVGIVLELDRPEGPYYPGDPVHLNIHLESEKDLKVQELRASLIFWERYQYTTTHTTGYGKSRSRSTRTHWGTATRVLHKEKLLGEGTIPAGFHQTYSLDWSIPQDAAPPYAGRVIRSGWLIKVTLDRKLRKDINEELKVPVVVPPPGRWAEPGEYGEASHSEEADMALWLPRLEWVEGETIQGKVIVRARSGVSASGVRIELLRNERVTIRGHGRGGTFSKTEFKDRIARGVKLNAGEVREFPFSVPVPEIGCPSRDTSVGTVRWSLKGILDRRLRRDFTVAQEIYVFNGSKS